MGRPGSIGKFSTNLVKVFFIVLIFAVFPFAGEIDEILADFDLFKDYEIISDVNMLENYEVYDDTSSYNYQMGVSSNTGEDR